MALSQDIKQPQTMHVEEQQQQQQPMPSQPSNSGYRTLHVNFAWRKFNAFITEPGSDDPMYLATFNPWKMKTKFRAGPAAAAAAAAAAASSASSSDSDDKSSSDADDTPTELIGESQVHPFKIDCQTQIRGRPVRVSAAKKILTRYTYPSLAFATSPHKPAIMTWKAASEASIKVFDFVLLDENEQIVARFNPRYLGVRRLATIEIVGAKARDPLAIDEIVITGLSLYFTMIYRTSNPVPLIGAVVARPGKDYKVTHKQAREEEERNMVIGADEFLNPYQSKFENPDKMWALVDEGAKA